MIYATDDDRWHARLSVSTDMRLAHFKKCDRGLFGRECRMCYSVETVLSFGATTASFLMKLETPLCQRAVTVVQQQLTKHELKWRSSKDARAAMDKLLGIDYNGWRFLIRHVNNNAIAYLARPQWNSENPWTISLHDGGWNIQPNLIAWDVVQLPVRVCETLPPDECCKVRAAFGGGEDSEPLTSHRPLCYNCRQDARKRCDKCGMVYFCSAACNQQSWVRHKRFCRIASAW